MIKTVILSLLISWGSAMNFKMVKDNMEFQMDKRAHLGVSFGLYYTSYTLFNCSDGKVHWGFSKEDMVYNFMGVFLANAVHRVFIWGKEFVL